MQEQEQKQFDIDAQKKALIGNGIILFVLVIGIILAVFAWFSVMRTDVELEGVHLIASDNLNITFNTYAGRVLANGKIGYDEDPLLNLNNEDYDETAHPITIFPGERKYFKTVINNAELQSFNGYLALTNTYVNSQLLTTANRVCISFAANLEGSESQQDYDLVADASRVDNTFSTIGIQPLYKNISLPAGTNTTVNAQTGEQETGNVIPGTVTVYWYVVLNGDAVENDMMNQQMIKFNNIRFFVSG